jgi:hypothetical protein
MLNNIMSWPQAFVASIAILSVLAFLLFLLGILFNINKKG